MWIDDASWSWRPTWRPPPGRGERRHTPEESWYQHSCRTLVCGPQDCSMGVLQLKKERRVRNASWIPESWPVCRKLIYSMSLPELPSINISARVIRYEHLRWTQRGPEKERQSGDYVSSLLDRSPPNKPYVFRRVKPILNGERARFKVTSLQTGLIKK